MAPKTGKNKKDRERLNIISYVPQKRLIKFSMHDVLHLIEDVGDIVIEDEQLKELTRQRTESFLFNKYQVSMKVGLIEKKLNEKEEFIKEAEDEEVVSKLKQDIKKMLENVSKDLELLRSLHSQLSETNQNIELMVNEEKKAEFDALKAKREKDILAVEMKYRNLQDKNNNRMKAKTTFDSPAAPGGGLKVAFSEDNLEENEVFIDIEDSKDMLNKLRDEQQKGLLDFNKKIKCLQNLLGEVTVGLQQGIDIQKQIGKDIDETIAILEKTEEGLTKASESVSGKMRLIFLAGLVITLCFILLVAVIVVNALILAFFS